METIAAQEWCLLSKAKKKYSVSIFGALPKRVFFFISGSSQKWNYLQLGEEYASCQWQANIEKERKQEGLFFFVLDWISGKKTGMGEKTKNAGISQL